MRADALFLDLDGTLVDFAAHPEHVIASDDLRALLVELARAMNGAVALITGRSIASADAVLDGVLVHVAGVHGFERRNANGVAPSIGDTSRIAGAAADAQAMVRAGALDADIENKGAALALHYRRAPHEAGRVRRAAAQLAQRHGLSVLEGKSVIELTLGLRTKGDAIADFMADAPFAGRAPIAIGDDVTDEDAFASVRALHGRGVLVGPIRPTAAAHRLDDVAAVIAWLTAGLCA